MRIDARDWKSLGCLTESGSLETSNKNELMLAARTEFTEDHRVSQLAVGLSWFGDDFQFLSAEMSRLACCFLKCQNFQVTVPFIEYQQVT